MEFATAVVLVAVTIAFVAYVGTWISEHVERRKRAADQLDLVDLADLDVRGGDQPDEPVQRPGVGTRNGSVALRR